MGWLGVQLAVAHSTDPPGPVVVQVHTCSLDTAIQKARWQIKQWSGDSKFFKERQADTAHKKQAHG
jgi:hypothetical protein